MQNMSRHMDEDESGGGTCVHAIDTHPHDASALPSLLSLGSCLSPWQASRTEKLSLCDTLRRTTKELQSLAHTLTTLHGGVPEVVTYRVGGQLFALHRRLILKDPGSLLFLLANDHYPVPAHEADLRTGDENCITDSAKHTKGDGRRRFAHEANRQEDNNMHEALSNDDDDDDDDDNDDDACGCINKHDCRSHTSTNKGGTTHDEAHVCANDTRHKCVQDRHYPVAQQGDAPDTCAHLSSLTSSLHTRNRQAGTYDNSASADTHTTRPTVTAHSLPTCHSPSQQPTRSLCHTSAPSLVTHSPSRALAAPIEIAHRDADVFARLANLIRGYRHAIAPEWLDACWADMQYYGLQSSWEAVYPPQDTHYRLRCLEQGNRLHSDMICAYASRAFTSGEHRIGFAVSQVERVAVGAMLVEDAASPTSEVVAHHHMSGTALYWNDGKVTTNIDVLRTADTGCPYPSPVIVRVALDLDEGLIRWTLNEDCCVCVQRLPKNRPFAFFVVVARGSQIGIVP